MVLGVENNWFNGCVSHSSTDFFTKEVVMFWRGLPTEVEGAPFLEVFKARWMGPRAN